MPCNSDYLNPNHRERQLQRTAKLLIYVCQEMSQPVEPWIDDEAENIYARDTRLVPELCRVLRSLSPEDRERIVYNAHDKRSRDLADWWEEHEKVDKAREGKEC